MKKLNNKIDMFCYRHPRFGIPNLMLYIVVISLAVWLLSIMDSSRTLMSYFAFSPELILKGQVWRLITFMFIPQDTSMWALLFFYFYYWIGSTLEREWGTARFNIFIFSGVLLTIIYGMVIYLITKQSASIGTYYIYLSMFFSFATLYPDTQVLFMFIIPVKIKWMAILDACYFAYIIFFCTLSRSFHMIFMRAAPCLLIKMSLHKHLIYVIIRVPLARLVNSICTFSKSHSSDTIILRYYYIPFMTNADQFIIYCIYKYLHFLQIHFLQL